MKIEIVWTTDDVFSRAEDLGYTLTDKQAEQVLMLAKSNHDATIGINWDVIDNYINEIL